MDLQNMQLWKWILWILAFLLPPELIKLMTVEKANPGSGNV